MESATPSPSPIEFPPVGGPIPELRGVHCHSCGNLVRNATNPNLPPLCNECLPAGEEPFAEAVRRVTLPDPLGPPCSDCGRPTSTAIADENEPLCNRCLSAEFVATAEILRESTRTNARPFGLGFCEIPSSQIAQTLRIDPPTPGAVVFILFSAIACLALGGIVMGVAYLSA